MKITACECTSPGWCERHKCQKSKLLWEYCRRLPTMFDEWEQGRGIGQGNTDQELRSAPCRHRSQQPVDSVECPVCRTLKRQIPLFACDIHERCMLLPYKNLLEQYCLIACYTCADYTSSPE